MASALLVLATSLCSYSPMISHGARPTRHAVVSLGLFDGFFSDPGKSTSVPAGFVKASHILLAGADAADLAEELRAKIQSGELSFADAAMQYSDCPSKGKGGELGIISSLSRISFLPYESKDVRAFDAVAFSATTPLNEIQVVETDFGTHLLKVDGRGS